MLDVGQDLTLGGSIAAQLVGDDYTRDILQTLEQLAEEPFGRAGAAPAPDQDVKHVSMLVHRAPEGMRLASGAQEHPVEVLLVVRL